MKNYTFNNLSKLVYLILIAASGVSSANAQAYSPLSPNSDLNCVYQPDGKTQIARQSGDTYQLTGFTSATKSAVKSRQSYVKKTGQIKKLISKLSKKRKKGIFEIDINAKEYKEITKFFFDGQISSAPPLSVDENVQILQGLVSTYNSDAKYEQELIKLIKNCKKRKIPLEGEFYTKFVNIIEYNAKADSTGSGYVAVMAIVPYTFATVFKDLCFSNDNASSIRYKQSSKTPCFTAGLSNRDPETCDNLITYSNGYPDYYLAVLDAKQFLFSLDGVGIVNFADAAKAAEVTLRTKLPYVWGDSVKYAIGSVDNCNAERFE